MYRDAYSGRLKLDGEQHLETLQAASNYANALLNLKRFEEAKALLRKSVPTVRRVLGENDQLTLKMRKIYARALYEDASATLDEIREAVKTLEDTERVARRVLGGSHPLTLAIECDLRKARATLQFSLEAREAGFDSISEALASLPTDLLAAMKAGGA